MDAREYWETLAARGDIPMAWVDDPARVFHHHDDGAPQAWPWSSAQAQAVARDATGVATCEALAFELLARLKPWAAPQPRRVLWRFDSARAVVPRAHFLVPVESAMRSTMNKPWHYMPDIRPRVPQLVNAEQAELALAWKRLSRRRRLPAALSTIGNMKYSALLNPFEPLVEMWTHDRTVTHVGDEFVTITWYAGGADGAA